MQPEKSKKKWHLEHAKLQAEGKEFCYKKKEFVKGKMRWNYLHAAIHEMRLASKNNELKNNRQMIVNF